MNMKMVFAYIYRNDHYWIARKFIEAFCYFLKR